TESMRENPRPVFVEFKTFRMRGHEEASGTKYVPQELMDAWAGKDPLENFTEFLRNEGILSEKDEVKMKEEILHEINENLDIAFAEEKIISSESEELKDVYQNSTYQIVNENSETKELRFVDAVSEGLKQSMEQHENLVIMGQDIAEYGGVFKITDGFVDAFGKERVRNT
ncbi:MAG TPA: dehydrogenase, partial [Flavobacteriaceae bacterium]|nr:dehydrogenase [Flavobacteriaceae bacterium]